MQLRLADHNDVDTIMDIINHAKQFLSEQQIPQWQNQTGPNQDIINKDIDLRQGYVLEDSKMIVGYCALTGNVEKSYTNIKKGSWNETYPVYASIHRVALDPNIRGKGLSQILLKEIINQAAMQDYHDIRIDTHPQNIIMQQVIKRAGFNYIGDIELAQADGERIAFQLLK